MSIFDSEKAIEVSQGSDFLEEQAAQHRISEDTIASTEAQREHARNANPNGFSRTISGVSVKDAEADFADLQRELSHISQKSRLSKTRSRRDSIRPGSRRSGKANDDVEKTATSESSTDAEQFDLESTLRGGKAADEQAGIRSKSIGVVWEGLTVTGTGGVTNFVKTFPDAFISFINVYATAKSIFGLGKKGKEVNILKRLQGGN